MEIENIQAVSVSELPRNARHYLLVGRYSEYDTKWYSCGDFERNRIDAEAKRSAFQGLFEYKIVEAILPIAPKEGGA